LLWFIKTYWASISNPRVFTAFYGILRAIYVQKLAPGSIRIVEKRGTS
jgi:hypothetical protein